MFRFYLPLLVTVLLASCTFAGGNPAPAQAVTTTGNPPTDSLLNYSDYAIQLKPQGLYANACATVKRQRGVLQSQYAAGRVSTDSAGRYFTEAVVNQLIPHWYGTRWSFEGHTSQPGDGEIACGYFVSTNLTHAGLNVNRYKVAQQTPHNEALTYACGDTVYTISGANTLIDTLLQPHFAEGLYFVGLAGSHVGLLLKRMNTIFFLHSNYVAGKAEIEVARESQVLHSYSVFYVTPLTGNRRFIEKWLKYEELVVKT